MVYNLLIRNNKKAAMELSMSTIVILVLAMTMLILGLTLVRTIFTGATNSVDELNAKTRAEITKLFTDEDAKVVVKLGSDRTARVKAGTENFGIGIGGKTNDGSPAARDLKYTLSLSERERENCLRLIGRNKVEGFIAQRMNTPLEFDRSEGDTAFAIIQVSIPEGTQLCTQKVDFEVKQGTDIVGTESFIIQIQRKGFFG